MASSLDMGIKIKESFCRKSLLKLLTQYKGLAAQIPHNGKFFPLWANSEPKLEFLELYSFTRQKVLSLHSAFMMDQFYSLFHLTLSTQAFDPYQKKYIYQAFDQFH